MTENAGGAAERIEAAVTAGPEQPARPVDEISAERAAKREALADRQAEAVEFDERCIAIGGCLMDLYTEGGKTADSLEPYVEAGRFPDEAAVALAEYEVGKRARKPEFDITAKHPRLIVRALERAFEKRTEAAEAAATETAATAEARETAATVVEDASQIHAVADAEAEKSTARARPAFFERHEGANVLDMLEAAASSPDLSETERSRAATFLQMRALAQTEADAAIIKARLAEQDFSTNFPDPAAFAAVFIFDNPDSDLSTGVSDATQAAVAELLGVERPDPKVVTGSDMTDIYEKGVGTRIVLDPETGETREEAVYLQPGEFVSIREGEALGLTDDGHRALKLDTEVGSFVTLLPDNAGPEDMVQYGLAGQMMSQLHEMNMAEIFFPGRSQMERGGGVLEVRMPGDFNRSQQLCQIFFGAFAGYDGELLNQADLDKIPYLLQFHNRKGDYAIGDINPEQMKADFRAQGVLDKSNTLNMARFEELVQANRTGLYVERNFALQNAA